MQIVWSLDSSPEPREKYIFDVYKKTTFCREWFAAGGGGGGNPSSNQGKDTSSPTVSLRTCFSPWWFLFSWKAETKWNELEILFKVLLNIADIVADITWQLNTNKRLALSFLSVCLRITCSR